MRDPGQTCPLIISHGRVAALYVLVNLGYCHASIEEMRATRVSRGGAPLLGPRGRLLSAVVVSRVRLRERYDPVQLEDIPADAEDAFLRSWPRSTRDTGRRRSLWAQSSGLVLTVSGTYDSS